MSVTRSEPFRVCADYDGTSPRGLVLPEGEAPPPVPPGVYALTLAPPTPYYEQLIARPDLLRAYPLRSQADLDALLPKVDLTSRKQPIVYDPTMDAAKLTIHAPVSTDVQQKLVPVQARAGSLLLTWDVRLDEGFRWREGTIVVGDREKGYMARHKAWRFDPVWASLKLDYADSAKIGQFAELRLTLNNSKLLALGSTRGADEVLFPRLAQFFLTPDTWTRVWWMIEGIEQPVCTMSLWAADAAHDPVLLYDRLALLPPLGGFDKFRIEFDTSADQGANPDDAHAWMRNLVLLRNPGSVPMVRP